MNILVAETNCPRCGGRGVWRSAPVDLTHPWEHPCSCVRGVPVVELLRVVGQLPSQTLWEAFGVSAEAQALFVEFTEALVRVVPPPETEES